MNSPARILPPRARDRPAPRQSIPEQVTSLTYLECQICYRRSMFLKVDIDTGVCVRCKPVCSPPTKPQQNGAG